MSISSERWYHSQLASTGLKYGIAGATMYYTGPEVLSRVGSGIEQSAEFVADKTAKATDYVVEKTGNATSYVVDKTADATVYVGEGVKSNAGVLLITVVSIGAIVYFANESK